MCASAKTISCFFMQSSIHDEQCSDSDSGSEYDSKNFHTVDLDGRGALKPDDASEPDDALEPDDDFVNSSTGYVETTVVCSRRDGRSVCR